MCQTLLDHYMGQLLHLRDQERLLRITQVQPQDTASSYAASDNGAKDRGQDLFELHLNCLESILNIPVSLKDSEYLNVPKLASFFSQSIKSLEVQSSLGLLPAAQSGHFFQFSLYCLFYYARADFTLFPNSYLVYSHSQRMAAFTSHR